MLKPLIKRIIGLFAALFCLFSFSGCAPVFIAGLMDASVHFEDAVKVSVYLLDDQSELGFTEQLFQDISLSSLIDGNETNVEYTNYASFKLKPKDDQKLIKINLVGFSFCAKEDWEFQFRLSYKDIEHTVTVRGVSNTWVFVSFNQYILSNDKEIKISLENKISVGKIQYRIDSLVIVGEEEEDV